MKPPVIDFHIHVTPAEELQPSAQEFLSSWVEESFKSFMDRYKSPRAMAQLLEENGVDFGVILAEYSPTTVGVFTNDFVAQLCQGYDSLMPFASVNPHTMPHPAKELERAVRELGCRGLKLYPPYQYYYPSDSIMYPVYEVAQELGIPVVFHTGTSVFKGSRIKYGNPLLLDDIVVDFPNLAIVMAHSGRSIWYREAFQLARLHKNVYMEISGLPPQRLLTYFPDLELLADKVIFGSDWPAMPGIKKNIDTIRSLPLKEETITKILGGNAAKLLKIQV